MSKNKDMTEKIRLLCKSVGPAKQTMTVARKDVSALKQKLSRVKTDRMKDMIQGAIEKRGREIEEAESIVYSFMNVVDGLDREERNVMLQLYLKGKKWSEVDSLDMRANGRKRHNPSAATYGLLTWATTRAPM